MKSRIYKNQKTKDLAPVSGPNAFTGIWTSSVGGRFFYLPRQVKPEFYKRERIAI
jgi:hypothetical protein